MKNLIVMIFIFLSLFGCEGESSGDDYVVQSTLMPTNNNYKSGSCGSNVISDYNSAVGDCKFIRTNADAIKCENMFNKFRNKYPGINCNAESGFGLNKKKVKITTSYIEGIINAL